MNASLIIIEKWSRGWTMSVIFWVIISVVLLFASYGVVVKFFPHWLSDKDAVDYTNLSSSGSTQGASVSTLPQGSAQTSTSLGWKAPSDVKVGDQVTLSVPELKLSSQKAQILKKHVYKEGGFVWYEFECDTNGKVVYIEGEIDEGAPYYSILLQELSLTDLPVSVKQLESMDDAEEGQFQFNQKSFVYDESDQAFFYETESSSQGESFYYWDFVCGDLCLGIEEWSDGDEYDVSLNRGLKKDEIRF